MKPAAGKVTAKYNFGEGSVSTEKSEDSCRMPDEGGRDTH